MVPVVPESFTHVLTEFDKFDPLISALRLDTGRLKCTCISVSRKWLALGTSAGGLHLIQREGWRQRLILTHKEGSLTHVACCPHDEDFIAVATSEGLVVIWELQVERRGRPERACVSWEHRGQAITALCWDTATLRVFIGDATGKVSLVRTGTSKPGKGSAFVIFPVQTVTTVDSRVVQLGYLEGHLLISSLSRCYLCDTEREKFWRVGNKERDGEYGACFLPQNQGGLRTPGTGNTHLVYCARPGSRIWEANFSGEVLSTHQFKQLLACPALPLISYKNEPHYNPAQSSPQSFAFRRLLHLSDYNLLTWTDSAIYIFTPHSGQVLLWTKIKDIADIAVFRNELFCLRADGYLCHLLLMPVDRCVEKLIKREYWTLAATVCCMFQHAIVTSRARKTISTDCLEQLKAQLNITQQKLIGQLEEVINRMEPIDSACSSRRSSISSHESFNVLDCGIYRIISRRGSQSDEDTSSLISQSMLEEERMKEFNFAQEEEQVEPDSLSRVRVEGDKSDLGLQFHLPLSFRPKPPLIALQAVKDSVSSFVKKTTEKINSLQMNSDLWPRPDHRDGGQGEITFSVNSCADDGDDEETVEQADNDLQVLRAATEKAILQIQDPLVLLNPRYLTEVLLEWIPVLERVLEPVNYKTSEVEKIRNLQLKKKNLETEHDDPSTQPCPAVPRDDSGIGCQSEFEETSNYLKEENLAESNLSSTSLEYPLAIVAPVELTVPSDLQDDLSQLVCLYLDLGCPSETGDTGMEKICMFLRRFFFLIDQERVRKMCTWRYREQPDILNTYIACMLEFTQADKVVEVIQKGDLLKSLFSLRELQPWNAPVLLTHLYRLYEKHGEMAVRAYPQFYPTIFPSDIIAMVQPSHFLPYLDNLVHSQAEEQRLSFLESLVQPEALRQVWLDLALSHDAPRRENTLTADRQPKWHSHYFCWGYGRLVSLLIRLHADLDSKQKMMESCRLNGFWTGYLYLCKELQRRTEAFSAICMLDDMSLLEEPNGIVPETMAEWMYLIKLCQKRNSISSLAANSHLSSDATTHLTPKSCLDNTNGRGSDDGPVESIDGLVDGSNRVTVDKLVLNLARIVGPDPALAALQEHGLHSEMNAFFTVACELLRVSEKRQRALIQTMLERCDRFLWSQQA